MLPAGALNVNRRLSSPRLKGVVVGVSVYKALPGCPLLSLFTVTTKWLESRFEPLVTLNRTVMP